MSTSAGVDDWRIPDGLWEEMEPLIRKRPNTHRFGGGRPRKRKTSSSPRSISSATA